MANAPRNEEDRAMMLCASSNCWRRLCRDSTCSLNFCCYMCERNFLGIPGEQAHGPACSKKEKPPWDAPRASPHSTPGAMEYESKRSESGGGRDSRGRGGGARGRSSGGANRHEHVPTTATSAPPTWASLPIVTAPTGPNQEMEDVPQYLFWELSSQVVCDETSAKSISKFLSRCYPKAKQMAEANSSLAPLERIKVFVKEWMSETLYRYHQAGGDFVNGLTANTATQLFQQLCQKGAIPKSLVKGIGLPPRQWPFVQQTVNTLFFECGVNGADSEEDDTIGPSFAKRARHNEPQSRRSISEVRAGVPSSMRSTFVSSMAARPPRARSYSRVRSPLRGHTPPHHRRSLPHGRSPPNGRPSPLSPPHGRSPYGRSPPHGRLPMKRERSPPRRHSHSRRRSSPRGRSQSRIRSLGDSAEGREGCNSEKACVGSPGDALLQLSGGYVGVFCTKCVKILKDEDPNLTTTPVRKWSQLGYRRGTSKKRSRGRN